MLINLSNHPSDKWGIEQTNAALGMYGHTEDIPFPVIDPEAGIDEILKLAGLYADKCVKMFADFEQHNPELHNQHAVHIMGEMTFTYNLVRILNRNDITCLASTTKRKVVEEENGKKTSVFEFIQFRAYHSDKELPF